MKKDLYLQVTNPCNEHWDSMLPEAKGRFCNACAKTVVDFSMMTDNEVLHYLQNHTGNVCGRFQEEQLERPLVETHLQPKKTWRYWLASAASVLALVNKGQAQQKDTHPQDIVNNANGVHIKGEAALTPLTMGKVAPSMVPHATTVRGFVTDEKGKPIIGASVMIKNTNKGVATDSNGNFLLLFPHTDTATTIRVSYIGYESKEVSFDIKTDRLVTVALHESTAMLGEVSVIGYVTATRSMRMGGLSIVTITRTHTTDIPAELPATESLRVYPNPAPKGSQVHIELKETGTHTIQLLDNQSRPLLLKQAAVSYKNQAVSLSIPFTLPSAYYYIRVINEATKQQTVSKLLVQ